jgi:hypothetical protein
MGFCLFGQRLASDNGHLGIQNPLALSIRNVSCACYLGTKELIVILNTGIHMCPQQQPGRPGTNEVRIQNCQENLLLGTLRIVDLIIIHAPPPSPSPAASHNSDY